MDQEGNQPQEEVQIEVGSTHTHAHKDGRCMNLFCRAGTILGTRTRYEKVTKKENIFGKLLKKIS